MSQQDAYGTPHNWVGHLPATTHRVTSILEPMLTDTLGHVAASHVIRVLMHALLNTLDLPYDIHAIHSQHDTLWRRLNTCFFGVEPLGLMNYVCRISLKLCMRQDHGVKH